MKQKFYVLVLLLFAALQNVSAGYVNGTMSYGGQTRKYVIYVPQIYLNQPKKVPLLVGLHGNGDNAANFSQICMSSAISDTANYIVVYPEALPDPLLTTNAWHSGAGVVPLFEVNGTVDDVGFINQLMNNVIASYQIDTNRMYVFGFSFGGFMTNKMAASSAKRFAAAACVAGERGNYNTSIPAVPVPYLHFHGTADSVITYNGTGGSFPALGLTPDNTTKFWATQNGCNLTPVIDTMPDLVNDGLRFIRYTYNHPTNTNKAILYKVVNGEHDWYYRPNNDLDYCQTIWEFFRRYSKTPNTTPGTPTASFTASDTTVCIGRTLTFTSTSTSSTGSLDSIRWTILGGTPSTGTTTPIISTFNTVGNYIITLKAYKSGNVSTVTKSIRVKALPNANAGADKLLTCSVTSLQLSGSSTTNGAAFSWTGSGIVSNGNTATPTVNKAGNYTLTVTVATCTSTDIAIVSIDTIRPTANAGADITLTCTNPTKLIGTPTIAGNNYLWSPANGLSNTTIAQPTANKSGTYTLTVSKIANGCTSTDAITVATDTTRPIANAGADITLTCSNPAKLIGTPTIAGNNYLWSPANGLSNTAIAQPSANKSGTYTLTVSKIANGCTSTDAVIVTFDTIKPQADAGPNLILTCTTTSVILGSNAVNGNTYSWSPTNGLSNSNIAQPSANKGGNYILTVTNTFNGCTSSDAVSLSMDTLKPNVQVSSSPICAGQTATLTASGADSYNWPTLGGNGNPKTTPILNTNTIYSVTGTKTSNGCTKIVSHTVVVNALPTTPTITRRNDTAFCSVTGTQYRWYLNNVLLTTTTVAFFKVTQNGNYKVEVVNNTCTSLASNSISITLTGVKYNKLDIGFSVFPNPTNGIFEVKITSIVNKTYQLKLYSLSGQLISEEEMNVRVGENSKNMNFVGIEKGVYFLSIIGDDGVATQSILIQ
ncbi:MAG: T9SS type A sorting domain-containing protein [Chitinophagales bacterium]|nr:T9SS type A sorting domain-containing protein [Chitinophagales bacterium]